MDFELQMESTIERFDDFFHFKTLEKITKACISIWSALLMFLIVSCSSQPLTLSQQNQLGILEKRVAVLEEQELKTLADLRDEVAEFKKKVLSNLDTYRQSQQFFIEDLNGLKKDIQIITNDNEKSQFDIRRNLTRIKGVKKRLGDQIIALQKLEDFFSSGVDKEPETPVSEQSEFDNAFQLFKKRQFSRSEKEFAEFRKKYPNSNLVGDSLYFIAYMNFLQAEYNKASLRFFELLQQFPQSNRLNDSKWWLGVSLERSGDLNGALDLYRELAKLEEMNPLRIKAKIRLEELGPDN